MKTVHFYNAQQQKLAATLHQPEIMPRFGVIFGHCFTCSRHTQIIKNIASRLVEKSIAALRFDFSGNGQSEGDFADTTYTKHIDEMKQAIAFLKEQGVEQVGLAGHSMGAAISVLTASQVEGIKGVCAIAGRLGGLDPTLLLKADQVQALRKNGRVNFVSRGRQLSLTQNFFSDAERYDIREAVRTLDAPLLVVHGDRDEIIPVENAHAAVELNPNARLMIIKGADHMFIQAEHREPLADAIAEWFEDNFII